MPKHRTCIPVFVQFTHYSPDPKGARTPWNGQKSVPSSSFGMFIFVPIRTWMLFGKTAVFEDIHASMGNECSFGTSCMKGVKQRDSDQTIRPHSGHESLQQGRNFAQMAQFQEAHGLAVPHPFRIEESDQFLSKRHGIRHRKLFSRKHKRAVVRSRPRK